MTNPLSMSMFASKEDLQAARISQLEADKAALMEVVRQFADPHNWNANRNMWARPDDPVKLAASVAAVGQGG